MREKLTDADWGYANRPPGKEIAVVVERREECYAEAAISHGVEQAVAGCRQEKIAPQGASAEAGDGLPKQEKSDGACQKGREEQGMCKSAMSPEVTVADAKPEAEDVEIGNNRTERSGHPDTLWRTRLIETGSDRQGCHRVREDRGHLRLTVLARTTSYTYGWLFG